MMESYIIFHYACSCGKEGQRPIKQPVELKMIYAAPDCLHCGNVVLVTPIRQCEDDKFVYKVKVCKPERETELQTR